MCVPTSYLAPRAKTVVQLQTFGTRKFTNESHCASNRNQRREIARQSFFNADEKHVRPHLPNEGSTDKNSRPGATKRRISELPNFKEIRNAGIFEIVN